MRNAKASRTNTNTTFSCLVSFGLTLVLGLGALGLTSYQAQATASSVEEGEKSSSSGGRYLVQISGENAVVTLNMNGVDAERWLLKKRATAGASINHWLKQGVNVLSFSVEPIPSRDGLPTSALSSASGAAASAPVLKDQDSKENTVPSHVSEGKVSLSELTRAVMTGPVHVRAWFMGMTPDGAISNINLVEQEVAISQDGRGKVIVRFGVPSSPTLSLWLAERAAGAPNRSSTQETGPSLDTCQHFINKISQEIVAAYQAGRSPLEVESLALERQDAVRAYGGSTLQPTLELSRKIEAADIKITSSSTGRDLLVERIEGTQIYRLSRKDGHPLVLVQTTNGNQTTRIHSLLIGWMSGGWRILRRAY